MFHLFFSSSSFLSMSPTVYEWLHSMLELHYTLIFAVFFQLTINSTFNLSSFFFILEIDWYPCKQEPIDFISLLTNQNLMFIYMLLLC